MEQWIGKFKFGVYRVLEKSSSFVQSTHAHSQSQNMHIFCIFLFYYYCYSLVLSILFIISVFITLIIGCLHYICTSVLEAPPNTRQIPRVCKHTSDSDSD